jgi:hypothetical protein
MSARVPDRTIAYPGVSWRGLRREAGNTTARWRDKSREVRRRSVVLFQGLHDHSRGALFRAPRGTPFLRDFICLRDVRVSAMSGEDDFRIRPGRIRSTRAQRRGPSSRRRSPPRRRPALASRAPAGSAPAIARLRAGPAASVRANRLLTGRSRGAVIKARVVRHRPRRRSRPISTICAARRDP